jgi:hypothetical protein
LRLAVERQLGRARGDDRVSRVGRAEIQRDVQVRSVELFQDEQLLPLAQPGQGLV